MPRKTKIHQLRSLLKGNAVTALSVVLLCVSLGAFLIPGIFADTPVYGAVSITANPKNNASYAVTVNWDGKTSDHWKLQVLNSGGTVIKTIETSSKTYTTDALTCDKQYSFRVAVVGPKGGVAAYKESSRVTPPCAAVALGTPSSTNSTVTASWTPKLFAADSYTMYIAGGGNVTTATSFTKAGLACATTYQVYVVATANKQTGSPSITRSIATAACPAPTPTPTPTPPPAKTTPVPTKKKTTTGSPSAATPAVTAVVPANFSADVVSGKIVNLEWDASAGTDHYLVNRSTDNTTWTPLTNTKETTYTDDSAEFSKTYYYQLQAISASNVGSDFVTAQVTTETFKQSGSVITSQDKLVSVKIPDGALESDYSCNLTTADTEADAPEGQSSLLGSYDLLCVGQDGSIIDEFQKPLQVTIKLESVASGYENITVGVLNDDTWKTVNSTYDQAKQQISFTMTSANTFAAFGEKQSSPVGVIIGIFLLLLLLAAGVGGFLWWRRRAPAQPASAQSMLTAEQEFKQALAQPDCSHLGMAQQVVPSSAGCYECEQQHTKWNALRICLICGHVGCSDDSSEQHALKHYQETGHPIIYEYGNPAGNTIGWCYVDQTYI